MRVGPDLTKYCGHILGEDTVVSRSSYTVDMSIRSYSRIRNILTGLTKQVKYTESEK